MPRQRGLSKGLGKCLGMGPEQRPRLGPRQGPRHGAYAWGLGIWGLGRDLCRGLCVGPR